MKYVFLITIGILFSNRDFAQLTYDNGPIVSGTNFVTNGTWNKNSLTFSFLNGTSDILNDEEKNAIREALKIWSDYTNLTFIEQVSGNTDLKFGWYDGDHGDGVPFDGRNGIIGHAFYPPPNPNAGLIHFDDAEDWSMSERFTSLQPIDLITVAAHEIGHALGLNHSNVNCSLMNPNYWGSHRYLSQDDIDGIQSIYGNKSAILSTNNYGICSNATYYFRNLPTNSNITWQISDPSIVSLNVSNNQATLTRINNSNGRIRLTAIMMLPCGSTIQEFVDLLVGDRVSGYFTINSNSTQFQLGTYKSITAQRGATSYFTFNADTTTFSSPKWTWDNSYSNSNPITIGITAPSTGYTTTTKYINLNGITGCGPVTTTTTIAITSLGWSYYLVTSSNQSNTNLNVNVVKTISSAHNNTPFPADYAFKGKTEMCLFEITTGKLVKKWKYDVNGISNYNLDISTINKGIYLLKYENNDIILTKKIFIK